MLQHGRGNIFGYICFVVFSNSSFFGFFKLHMFCSFFFMKCFVVFVL